MKPIEQKKINEMKKLLDKEEFTKKEKLFTDSLYSFVLDILLFINLRRAAYYKRWRE